jgi:predicted ester cyclase
MKILLMILPLALILCFTVGCQDKAAMEELEAFKAQAAVEKQNVNLIRDMVKHVDEEGMTGLDKYYSSDCVAHFPGGRDVQGLEAITLGASQMKAAFPDMSHIIEDIIAHGDLVAVRFSVKMTHTGEFQGIPPSGKQLSGSMMEFNRISEGKIVEVWQEADSTGLMLALGMELKPKDGK